MQTIAIANHKGGTGKTTTAVHMAVGLAARGSRVLLVDMDAQAHASAWTAGPAPAGGRPGLAEWMTGAAKAGDVMIGAEAEDGRGPLDLVPASRALVDAASTLKEVVGGQMLLREKLEPLSKRYDYCILDCPPALDFFTVNALVAADGVLVPIAPAYLSLVGLADLNETLGRVRQRLGGRARILGYMLFAADFRERLAEEVRNLLRAQAPDLLMKAHVRLSTAGKTLPDERTTAFEDGADPRGKEDYNAVLAEMLKRLGGKRKGAR